MLWTTIQWVFFFLSLSSPIDVVIAAVVMKQPLSFLSVLTPSLCVYAVDHNPRID